MIHFTYLRLIPFLLLGQVVCKTHNAVNDTVSSIVYMVQRVAEIQYESDRIVREGMDDTAEPGSEDQLFMFSTPLSESLQQHKCGFIQQQAARELKRFTGLDFQSLVKMEKWKNAWETFILKKCQPHANELNTTCDEMSNFFRRLDGSCNNEKHPSWGMALRAQRRYLPPQYSDGIGSLRDRSVMDGIIPSARGVSNALFKAKPTPTKDPQLTVLHMAFGQFLDHDLIFTPVVTDEKGRGIKCCDSKYKSLECIQIDIPASDPDFNHTCMNLVRSTAAISDDSSNGHREQLNEATSFVDASNVYGSSVEKAHSLREFKDGLMKLGVGSGLPEGKTKCFKDVPSDYCQDAGDKRVNVVPNLSAVHLLFVLEHNRIARILHQINPHWHEDLLYYEARKIVIALMQHIVYNEYLPPLVGRKHMDYYSLTIKPNYCGNTYDEKIDPTITNVFGVGAFRFGHSQITNTQEQFNKNHEAINVTDIVGTYHRPHFCEMNMSAGYVRVMRWMTDLSAMKADREFETGVRNQLFPTKTGLSFDLPAINVQRGRDHGIPTYNKWREWCGLPKAKNFFCRKSGLVHHDRDAIKALASVYRSPDDIDLYAGAMSERHLEGASVGPTFACIISKQFYDLKFGDRFWYENSNMTHSFKFDQLNQIKNMTLSSIICKNFDFDEIQPYAFKKQTTRNEYISCKNLPDIDFSLWNSTNTDHNWPWSSMHS